MSIEFDIKGLDRLANQLKSAPAQFNAGARKGVSQVMDDWRLEATSIAPYKDGTLQRSITVDTVAGQFPGEMTGTISANAVRGGFNYAYYIHEVRKQAVTGEPRFLEVPAKENEQRWFKVVEDEIKRELKGW